MNKLLLPQDVVGGSFWLIYVAMIGAAIFFFLERGRLSPKWGTVMNLVGVIALMSSIHYFYAKNLWVLNGQAPTALRYIDWLLTVPLLIIEFYLILKAVTTVRAAIFYKLLIGSIVMLLAGYLGEAGLVGALPAFVVGMAAWFYIIYEIFAGETAKANSASGNEAAQTAYAAMKWIVTIGWIIYPAGYFLGYLTAGGVDANSLNLIYNLADFVNKILFGLVIFAAAAKDSNA